MANTTNDTAKKEATKKDDVKELKAQLKEQQKQIEQLMDMLTAQNSKAEPEVKPAVVEKDDIGSDDEVLVISLVPNKLNMLDKDGRVIITFNGMYDEQYIDFASLRDAVNSHRDMALNGRFYIADERAVSKLRLRHHYEKVLTPKQFEDIINSNIDVAAELYKVAPKGQQKVIINIIKEKRMNGVDMDMNMLHKLSEVSGTDLVNVENVMDIKIK